MFSAAASSSLRRPHPCSVVCGRVRNSALDDLQMVHDPRNLLQLHAANMGAIGELSPLHAAKQQQIQILTNATVFSDRQSELTCNASGSRKRAREESMAMPPGHNPTLSPLFGFLNPTSTVTVNPAGASGVSGFLSQCRQPESGATSTSGRQPSSLQQVSSSARDLVSVLYQQNLEIDALVRLQSERLRVELEEARKRHCRALLSVLEQQVANRLMEKEAELQNASRRNAELQEKMRQINEENRIWFSMAKNNEAIVCNLRTSLEQALLQGANGAAFGDGECAAAFPADDAQSCCFEVEDAPAEDARRRKTCKACGERDVCVLLLPCRHLCLCKECEATADECPICGTAKNAYLQVFMC
ncbi:BOI-related E3 ubiquitin-protein ligase 1-like [Canna indica]|uniref:BOI-related E3 ubiquitin-protein ligase 1-like n=1 Tax=Canna indica TaxID=4628 RepID=A0AAQ3K8C4_9LILI|nr:BOI-related E3 ubiquitin-protein ligase 1-like [Canna indica]